jgi:hypothetical protein
MPAELIWLTQTPRMRRFFADTFYWIALSKLYAMHAFPPAFQHPQRPYLPHPASPVQHQPKPCCTVLRLAPGRCGGHGKRRRRRVTAGEGVRPGGRGDKGCLDFLYIKKWCSTLDIGSHINARSSAVLGAAWMRCHDFAPSVALLALNVLGAPCQSCVCAMLLHCC